MAYSIFEGLVAVKAGMTGVKTGKPIQVIKIVPAGVNDKAYEASDVVSVLAAVQRGMEATGAPLSSYAAYLPGVVQKTQYANYTKAELTKALAMPGAEVSVRRGKFGPQLAVMMPLEGGTKARNQSF